MKADLTDITVVLDRSGSMETCRTDAEGGLNAFVDDQKTKPGDARFTLIQFDTEYEFVHRAIPLRDVPKCTLTPRGRTALLDAIGRGIAETGERLKAMTEDQRPGLVVMVIVTDGQENSSREFTKLQIRAMIERQQTAYKWQFTFLGANQDAFAEAAQLGLPQAVVANYARPAAAFKCASDNVSRMRTQCAAGSSVKNEYTSAERAKMTSKT